MRYCVVSCHVMLLYAVLCCAGLHYVTRSCSVVWSYVVHFFALLRVTFYNVVSGWTGLDSTGLDCIGSCCILGYVVLCCIVLSCTFTVSPTA